jgi:hypothetical protein
MGARNSGIVLKPLMVGAEIRVPAEGRAFAALASDVSAEGVFVATFHEVAEDTEVIVELSLPDGPLRAEGVVQRADERRGRVGFSILFEALTPSDAARFALLSRPDAGFG